MVLKEVRHIPELRLNLISSCMLDKEDFNIYFGKKNWKLTEGSLVAGRGKKCCTLYKMQEKLHRGRVSTSRKDSSLDLAHEQLGHTCKKCMKFIAKEEPLSDTQDQIMKTTKGKAGALELGIE